VSVLQIKDLNDNQMMEATIKVAQYLSSLTSRQDVTTEMVKVLYNFFNADFAAFGQRDSDGKINICTPGFPENTDLSQENLPYPAMKKAVKTVLEEGFFTQEQYTRPKEITVAFFPVKKENNPLNVMMIGHLSQEPIPKKVLNVYLAVAGLASTTEERLSSERELKQHRYHLKQLVDERTKSLLEANARLEEEIKTRRKAQEKVMSLLDEKTLILKEAHHRIKNNMNTMYGLLFLRADSIDNAACSRILEDAASRVRSMMILYNKLYKNDDQTEMSFKNLATSLFNDIFKLFPDKSHIRKEIIIEDFILDAKRLMPVSIILNEMITNSMKYAFNDQKEGTIKLEAFKRNDSVTLVYSNNGPPIPESVTFENSGGFGMQLIASLVEQLYGTIRIDRTHGTSFIIQFGVDPV